MRAEAAGTEAVGQQDDVALARQGLGPLRIAAGHRAAATVQGDDGRGADRAGGADQGAVEHDPARLGDADVLNAEGGVVKQGEQRQKFGAQWRTR